MIWSDVPFPHIVLDWRDFPIAGMRGEFPPADSSLWQIFDNPKEVKKALDKPQGPHTQEYVRTLRRPEFIAMVQKELDIGGECEVSLHGGGYHYLPAGGGKLDMHVDFNVGPTGLYRRANILLYLNADWKPGDGGELVLSPTRDPEIDPKVIEPTWGTLVIMPTGENTWHGNPNPCTKERFSFAMYLFSTEPAPGFTEPHSTVF